jgi:hypothetical protein
MSGTMHINIIHRCTVGNLLKPADRDDFNALQLMQTMSHQAGLKTTMLVGAPSMHCPEVVAWLKNEAAEHGDELGLSLHSLEYGDYEKRYGTKEGMFYLLPFETRKRVFVDYMELFRTMFGNYPVSVAAYLMDARTLNWIHEEYPMVTATITSCFEEGVKMFHGNLNQWYLFTDGGPWGAYYPSRANSLVPAGDEKEFCGIVGLPHLNRDMLMAITSRDDLFSSHPSNLVRAKAYQEDRCSYMYHFVDEWEKQLALNGWGYYNTFVSPTWLTDNSMLDETGAFNAKFYRETLEYLGRKCREGVGLASTMGQFATWFKENVPVGAPEVNHWHDLICGTKRQMYWYADPYFRVTVDGNTSGALYDIRPWAGRVERNLGIDTPNLCNMNYPFLLSCEHRGGVHDGSIHTLRVRVGAETKEISCRRSSIEATTVGGHPAAVIKPVTLKVGGVDLVIESRYLFKGGGVIEIERRLVRSSDPSAVVTFIEYHCGCHGNTTYPEDMRGIVLGVEGKNGAREQLTYAYQSRELSVQEPVSVQAAIPQLGCQVVLESQDARVGYAREGWLFKPFFWLTMEKDVCEGEVLATWLKIQKIG